MKDSKTTDIMIYIDFTKLPFHFLDYFIPFRVMGRVLEPILAADG